MQIEEWDFIPHYFDSEDICNREAQKASLYLSDGHYFSFEVSSGIFSWLRSDCLGRISGKEMMGVIKNAPPRKKYFIDCDQDCHDYLIPVEKREDWEEWNRFDTDNYVPEYAIPISRVSSIEFEYEPKE